MKEFLKVLTLIIVAMGAGPVGAAFYSWSTNPATDATIDPSINWSEGMSPSSINDSARAMMARLAEFRDDISGGQLSQGSGSAYNVVTKQGFPATPAVGSVVAFTAHADSVAGASMQVDGGNAYALRLSSSSSVDNGSLVVGGAYTMVFTSGAWTIRDALGGGYLSTIPLGMLVQSTISALPNSNFVVANGQCISRTTFATYFAAVGTTYGVCDGSTTFGVVDMRGRVMAGLDNLGGTAPAGRLTAATCGAAMQSLGDTCGSQSTAISQSQLPAVAPTFSGINATISVTSTPTNVVTGTVSPTQAGAGATIQVLVNPTGSSGSIASTGSYTPAGTVSTLGSGTSLGLVQPTVALNYFVRVK